MFSDNFPAFIIDGKSTDKDTQSILIYAERGPVIRLLGNNVNRDSSISFEHQQGDTRIVSSVIISISVASVILPNQIHLSHFHPYFVYSMHYMSSYMKYSMLRRVNSNRMTLWVIRRIFHYKRIILILNSMVLISLRTGNQTGLGPRLVGNLGGYLLSASRSASTRYNPRQLLTRWPSRTASGRYR